MRKLVLFLHSSLDGFVEGPAGPMDIGFVAFDEDLQAQAQQVLSTVDTVLWGRGTYEMMYSYWPTVLGDSEASDYQQHHAKWIENVEKIVFSTKLDAVEWRNSRLVKENIAEEIQKLKAVDGQDILVLGSPRLAHELMKLGLIDEFKLTVSPVLVGRGLRLFENIENEQALTLVESKTFDSGALFLNYKKR